MIHESSGSRCRRAARRSTRAKSPSSGELLDLADPHARNHHRRALCEPRAVAKSRERAKPLTDVGLRHLRAHGRKCQHSTTPTTRTEMTRESQRTSRDCTLLPAAPQVVVHAALRVREPDRECLCSARGRTERRVEPTVDSIDDRQSVPNRRSRSSPATPHRRHRCHPGTVSRRAATRCRPVMRSGRSRS